MARLADRDAPRWAALGGRVARAVEPRLDPRVLGNRAEVLGTRWRLAPVGPALGRARRAARMLAASSPLILRTDVTAFYPSIEPSVAHDAVLAVAGREDARPASGMLEGWESEGYAGLPIGPEASAVLANAVLRPADEDLAGLPFLRWVDDYLIGVRSEREAADALDRLDTVLATLGLCRSAAKTGLVEGGRGFGWLGTSGAEDTSD